nr:homeodomain-like protein [Tanacetum cinerariifolium]
MRTIENNNVGFTKNTTPKLGPRETFECYLHESYKRQEGLDRWIKLFVQKTDQDLIRYNTAIKSLEERVTFFAHTISINQANHTPITHLALDITKSIRKECIMKLEPSHDTPFTKVETFAEKEDRVPIILGRPMLATTHAKIDVFGKKDFFRSRNRAGVLEDLKEFLMNEDINEDLRNFLKENRLLPNFDHQEAISFSLSSSSEIFKDSYRTSQDSNNNMSIGNFEIDELWDDMDPRTLTRYNDHTKSEFFSTENRVHQHNPYNLQVTFNIGFVNFNPYIDPHCPFNIISRAAYNTIMTRELVYTENNIVGLARNLNVFIGYHKFLIDFIVVENICEFVEKRLTEVVFGKPFKDNTRFEKD